MVPFSSTFQGKPICKVITNVIDQIQAFIANEAIEEKRCLSLILKWCMDWDFFLDKVVNSPKNLSWWLKENLIMKLITRTIARNSKGSKSQKLRKKFPRHSLIL